MDVELFYDKYCLEEMYYYHTINDVADLIETHGYTKVLQDIVTILSQRAVDNTDKQE